MQKEQEQNKVSYMVALVSEFAKKHEITDAMAFSYLQSHNAIQLVDEEYDIAHTLSFNDMVDDLTQYCQRQGGTLQ